MSKVKSHEKNSGKPKKEKERGTGWLKSIILGALAGAAVIVLVGGVLYYFFNTVAVRKSADVQPHLISESEAETYPVRPIDSMPTKGFEAKNSLVVQLDEMVDMVYAGGDAHKPDLTDAMDEVKQTYAAAERVLNRYIRNDFTDYQKVHAIHDYLAYYTEYDFDLLASTGGNGTGNNPAFRVDGVFLNKIAVCDGISKAFMLLCGMEQIRCIRVTGEYVQGESTQAHAWNKVYLDGDWYNVDVTMDMFHVNTGKERIDVLNHGYFLVSDEQITDSMAGRHVRSHNDAVDYACNKTYDFYSATPLGIGDYTMEITSQEDLNEVFAAVKNSKRKIGKLELKLNFSGYDKSNLSLADAYLPQIKEAYGKVRDADFALSEKNGAYPYQRYPDGVFVFLIYR